ncbi:cytochrome C [Rhodoferax sp. GW822-FHT02A01]|uniref:c-type cytochrome n=1 Tax=Rhodoferax sp. GW822-FHT02A01 TaxID=3141537 RepID=UPI00315DBCA9
MPRLLRLFLWCCIVLGLNSWAWAGRVFEDSMAQRTLACTACHGDQGRAGPDGYYPRLAGKPAGYLLHQLQNFRDGRRHYALMQGLLGNLDEPYLRAIANHFAAQNVAYPPPVKGNATAAELERGRKLVQEGDAAQGLPACTQCHGTLLTGVNPDIPGLLGLPSDYLNAQLGGWQTGQRRAHAPDCMAQIAKRLSATDTNAIARWLSAQPVPANGHPADQKPAPTALSAELRCGSAP